MALTKYEYYINGESPTYFPNGAVNPDKLTLEITESAIVTAFDHIYVKGSKCSIYFKDSLSAGDEDILDGIAAAHTGELLPDQTPKMADGRPIVRADSRPVNTQTYFTGQADDVTSSPGDIGGGNDFFWDFSNSDNDLDESPTPPGPAIPSGYKRKRIVAQFHDPLYLKDGTFYWMGATKGSYIHVHVVCPNGHYYYDRDGQLAQANGDVIIETFVNKHFIADDCPMGDEVNAEGAQVTATPTNYQIWLDITVPDADNTSYGWALLECYRARSVLYPGETP